MNFTEIAGILWNFRNFANFEKLHNFRANGDRFSPTLQNVAIIKQNGMHFLSFSPGSRFFAKRQKFRKFHKKSLNFEEFPEI